MSETIQAVRRKLDRVEEHLKALDEGFNAFLKKDPYRSVGKLQPDGRTVVYKVTEIKEPFPEELLPRVGEILYHLRSSLDYIALGLAVACGAKRGKVEQQTQFPITTSYRTFCEAVTRGNLPSLTNEALQAIESLQAYHRWERSPPSFAHPLRNLRDLSNIDKHRQPVVVATAIDYIAHWQPPGVTCNFDPTGDPVKVGATLGDLVCDQPVNPKVNVDAEFSYRITFKDVRVVTGGVVEELRRIAWFVESEVVPRFGAWFLPKRFTPF